MSKYHISPKTGRANVCRATTKPCPLGGDAPHFDSKADAEAHIQAELEASYSTFATKTQVGEKFITAVWDAVFTQGEGGKYSHSPEQFLSGLVEDESFNIVDSIAEPDYNDTVLIEKDGKYYSARTHGYDWDGKYDLLALDQVEPHTVQQEKTRVEHVEKITGLKTMMKELESLKDNKYLTYSDEETGALVINAAQAVPERIERPDGTALIIEPIKAEGDRSLSDLPHVVDIPLDFEENGERQNAREMDEGLLIYDTRKGRGLVMKWRGGSEISVQDSRYDWDGQALRGKEYSSKWYSMSAGDLYTIEGTGEFQTATYYKKV